jgi:hypothetical protein
MFLNRICYICDFMMKAFFPITKQHLNDILYCLNAVLLSNKQLAIEIVG